MPLKGKIAVYDPEAFTRRFMPGPEVKELVKEAFGSFFIVRVEDMYRLVQKPVPASRATTHSCLYITEGEAVMKIGSDTYTIHQHEMLFVPAGQVFSFGEKDVNKGYLCNFPDDMLIGKIGNKELLKTFEFLRVWGNPCIRLDVQTARFVLHLFQRIFMEYTESGLRHADIIQSYFITLLCEVNRCYQPGAKGGQSAAAQLTHAFRELLFTHIKTLHLVTDYATRLNISPNHLNKTVKAVTGKSPTRWIDETIVLEAKVLLSQSSMSISEVAMEVGIEDPSYFTRLFRKQEGIAPSAFRKMIEMS